jgi:hypothetical protein
MEISLEQKLIIFTSAHPRFQEKNLLKTRLDLSREILSMNLPEDRRSWLIHRLSYAHTPEEVLELINQVLC